VLKRGHSHDDEFLTGSLEVTPGRQAGLSWVGCDVLGDVWEGHSLAPLLDFWIAKV
jgi:hypothetical protein